VGTAAAANVHGKTGSLTATSALSGYVTTAAGDRLIFSLVANGFIGPPPKAIEDAVAVTLAAWADPIPREREEQGQQAEASRARHVEGVPGPT
jgi:serine-type D-Ala-D-Ala carboxypeptidase/endopeptidase (penicillin-binding protein 4)